MAYIVLDGGKLSREMSLRGLDVEGVARGAKVTHGVVRRCLRSQRVQWEKAHAIATYVRSLPIDDLIADLVAM